MFKFKYQTNDSCLEIEQPVAPSGADWEAFLHFITEFEQLKASPQIQPVQPIQAVAAVPKEEVLPNEIIRERLPNRDKGGNIIDIHELNVKMPTPGRAYKNFRCPTCGQSSIMITSLKKDIQYDYEQALQSGELVVRDIVNDDKLFSVDKNRLNVAGFTYEDACQSVIEEVVILSEDEATGENSCICCKCGAHEPINKFIDAYLNPLMYFDHETPCPMCGEELCISIDHDQQQVYKCENENCIYIKDIEPE